MKFAVSQTIFGCLHTEPAAINTDNHDPENIIPAVGVYVTTTIWWLIMTPAHGLRTGGMPRLPRWRKGFAPVSGDQHLGTASHYGIREFRDGVLLRMHTGSLEYLAAPLVSAESGARCAAGHAIHRRLS